MTATTVEERLPKWLAAIELEPDSDRYTSLLSAATELGDNLEPRDAVELVEYVFGTVNTTAFATVQAKMREHEPSFSPAPSDLEPRLLGGAAVAYALEEGTDVSDMLVSSVLSAEFGGWAAPIEELPQLARRAAVNRFNVLRDQVEVPELNVEALFDDLPAYDDGAVLHGEVVRPLAEASRSAAKAIDAAFGKLHERFERRLDASDEELDVLWWAFRDFSSTGKARWQEFAGAEAVLRSGVELADRHHFLSEIPSTHEILKRVLGDSGGTTFVLADVAGQELEGISLPAPTPGPLFPFLTAQAEWVGFGGKEGWVTSAGRYGVDPTLERTGQETAAQVTREILLHGALS